MSDLITQATHREMCNFGNVYELKDKICSLLQVTNNIVFYKSFFHGRYSFTLFVLNIYLQRYLLNRLLYLDEVSCI